MYNIVQIAGLIEAIRQDRVDVQTFFVLMKALNSDDATDILKQSGISYIGPLHVDDWTSSRDYPYFTSRRGIRSLLQSVSDVKQVAPEMLLNSPSKWYHDRSTK